jgi:hypothetical protein
MQAVLVAEVYRKSTVWNPASEQSRLIVEICYLNLFAARRYAARMAVRTMLVPEEKIARAIIVLRGHKVLLDAELKAPATG